MKIFIDGKYLNLKFSSAHFIIEHDKCSRLHGHNFYVSVEIEGDIIEEKGLILDFIYLKNLIKNICEYLDHKVLVPEKYAKIKENHVEISLEKTYLIPKEDVLLLPIDNVTSEALAKYICNSLIEKLKNHSNIKRIRVIVEEEPGQGAEIEKEL